MGGMCSMCSSSGDGGEGMCSSICAALSKYSSSFLYEGVALCMYVFLGCGAEVLNAADGSGSQKAFTFAFVAAAMIYMVSHRSGGHVNPATTLAYMFTRDVAFMEGICILLGQFAGAFLGCFLLSVVVPKNRGDALGANVITGDWSDTEGYFRVIIAEGVCMFAVLLVYYEVGVNKNSIARSMGDSRAVMAPLAIGLAIYGAHAFLIPIDGCSINAARSVSAAVFAWFRGADSIDQIWEDLWAMLIGQGAAVVAVVGWMYLLRSRGMSAEPSEKEEIRGMRTMSMLNVAEDVEDNSPETADELSNGGDEVDPAGISVEEKAGTE